MHKNWFIFSASVYANVYLSLELLCVCRQAGICVLSCVESVIDVVYAAMKVSLVVPWQYAVHMRQCWNIICKWWIKKMHSLACLRNFCINIVRLTSVRLLLRRLVIVFSVFIVRILSFTPHPIDSQNKNTYIHFKTCAVLLVFYLHARKFIR